VSRADLIGGRVLVTGASGGLGHAIARAFAARGASLVLTGRRAEVLEPLAAETGGRALACDLASRDDVRRLAEAAADVDVLVSNAALPGSGEVWDYTEEQVDRALDVNLRAPMQLARAVVPAMRFRGRGHLVFVSSLAGKVATGGSSVYSATKFGVRGFAGALRDDLRGSGVGVSVVFPGFVEDAGMFADTGVQLPGYVKLVRADEVAAGVLRAIERDRAEVDVMPLPQRLSAVFGSVAPELTNRVGRRLGSAGVAGEFADAQRDKR
jgi:short-subunit dehydrogenase